MCVCMSVCTHWPKKLPKCVHSVDRLLLILRPDFFYKASWYKANYHLPPPPPPTAVATAERKALEEKAPYWRGRET